ncbi:MAG TPA: hypothetical protein ENJ19_01910 [Gammaproteobacteria bacterium]|nr:hypothetical protein [Gammaproteobacteria bacterium]
MSLQGRKVCCFVALPHHSRFMWPVMEQVRQAGAEILFFTTSSDYPFERDVLQRGLPCRLLQEYADAATRDKIAVTQREFFEQWQQRIFDWDGMKHWPLVLQSSLISQALEEYHCLQAFMEAEQPDLVLALHERNRWGKLLGHMCRQFGAAYLTFQEGDYYEDRLSFTGHTEYTTALLLWGRNTRECLLRHGASRNKIALIGNTHLANVEAQYFTEAQRRATCEELGLPRGKKVVLFLVGLQWGVVKNADLWQALLDGLGDEVVKVFKWHPKVSAHSFHTNQARMFQEHFPDCIVVQDFDAYRLLAVSDYCVTLGKTTLAVEALCFGRPLFSLPGLDGEGDHYASQGIAQSVAQPVGWQPLFDTMRNGVPARIQAQVDDYLDGFFFDRNKQALAKARSVIEVLLAEPAPALRQRRLQNDAVAGRVSFILPSGTDTRLFLQTLVSLAEKVDFPDWEAVVVLNHPAAAECLAAVAGDVTVVECDQRRLAALYNRGAQHASGEILVFLTPGLLYFRAGALLDTARQGVAGVTVRRPDGTVHSTGIRFDFNSDPVLSTAARLKPEAAGGGCLALARKVYEAAGGFDATLADHLIEADFCLAAREAGAAVMLADGAECLLAGRSEFIGPSWEEEDWPGRLRFFAKWRGRLPKSDDYLAYLASLADNAQRS